METPPLSLSGRPAFRSKSARSSLDFGPLPRAILAPAACARGTGGSLLEFQDAWAVRMASKSKAKVKSRVAK